MRFCTSWSTTTKSTAISWAIYGPAASFLHPPRDGGKIRNDMKLRDLFIAAATWIPLLAAEDQPSALIMVYREEVKPGRMAALVHIEEDAARYCAKMHCPNPYVAISSFTGPNEV